PHTGAASPAQAMLVNSWRPAGAFAWPRGHLTPPPDATVGLIAISVEDPGLRRRALRGHVTMLASSDVARLHAVALAPVPHEVNAGGSHFSAARNASRSAACSAVR